MKTQPLVSFLIPVYNSELYIKEAINSCLNQTYKNIEICIVNDGSTDSSRDIIKIYEERFNNIKAYHFKRNKGKVAAFNKAYELSKGEYIAFFASDDVNYENRIEESLKKIGDYPLLFSDLDTFTNDGIIKNNLMKSNFNINSSREFSYKFLLKKPVVYGGTIFVKRKYLDNIFPLDSGLTHEDWWVPLLISYKYGNIYYYNKSLMKYRIHSNQSSGNRKELNFTQWSRLFPRDKLYYEKILNELKLDKKNIKIIQKKLCKIKIFENKNFFKKTRYLIKCLSFKNFILYLSPKFYFYLINIKKNLKK